MVLTEEVHRVSDVADEASRLAGGELLRHCRIQTDAAGAEEGLPIDPTGVYPLHLMTQKHLDRRLQIHRDVQLTSETVSAPIGQYPHHRIGADERPTHLVYRPVTAHHHDDVGISRVEGAVVGVVRLLGDEAGYLVSLLQQQ